MKKFAFQTSLPVTFLRENDQFVAYTPALDLSTSGSTFEEAQKRFGEAVRLFLEECHAMGTLDDVLSDLGWKKGLKAWMPPVVVAQDIQTISIPMTA